MFNSANYWLISFSSKDCVQICNSLYTNLTPVIKKCLKALCKPKYGKKIQNYKLPVQKESDCYNYGLFSIAFVTDVLNGLSFVDSCFEVSLMRSLHFNVLKQNNVLSSQKPLNLFGQQIPRSKC